MTDSGLLTEAIEHATQEVFRTMLDADIAASGDADSSKTEPMLVSFVGLTGNWCGTGILSCGPAVGCLAASRMFMIDVPDSAFVDENVLDAMAELTNMIIGNVKNLLSDHLGEMAISIPTVVYGRNFSFRAFTGTSERKVRFAWENHRFEVKICLAPTYGGESSRLTNLSPERAKIAA